MHYNLVITTNLADYSNALAKYSDAFKVYAATNKVVRFESGAC